MATSDYTSPIQCSICYNSKVNRQPRVLPCQHSFCTDCLSSWHNQRRQTGNYGNPTVNCPTCRSNAQLPSGNITALPIDINVEKIFEVMNKTQRKAQCHVCWQEKTFKAATVVCESCNLLLCEGCGNKHKQVALFSSHVVRKSFCQVHFHGYHWFCTTCSRGLCAECVHLGQHANHEVKDLNIGIADMKKKLDEATELLKTPLSRLDKEITATRHECGAHENILQMLSLMKEEIERITESVESHKALHISPAEKRLKENEKLRDDTTAIIKQSEDLVKQDDDTFLMKLPGPEREIIQNKTKIEASLELLPHHVRMQSDICHLAHAEKIVETLRNCKIVCVKSESMSVVSTPVFKIDCDDECEIKKPWRLCFTPDADVVVCGYEGGPVYKVFKDRTKKQLHCDGVAACTFGTAACVHGEDVFVISKKGDSLVQIKQDGVEVVHELNPPIPDSRGITVLGDTVLILNSTMLIKRSLADTQRNEDFSLTTCMNNLLHVTYEGKPRLFISDVVKNQVTSYSEHGDVLYRYGGKGKTDGMFDWPRGMTTMGDKHLLVADWSNHRIVQFEFDGTFVKNLLTKEDGISYPVDVAFKYPYLWVAENEANTGCCLKLFKCP